MDIFPDPQGTVDIIKANYGHAGMDFVKVVKKIGFAEVRRIQKDFQKEIMLDDKAQKQSISLSVVMAADKIATDNLFKDGRYIDMEEAKKILVAQEELSDGERCYQYIVDKVNMNRYRFDDTVNVEKWGMIEDGYAIFHQQALEELCEQGGFSKKPFLSWAKKNGAIQMDAKGNPGKQKKINGKNQRCFFVRLSLDDGQDNGGNAANEGGFVDIDQYGQEELPFR